MSNSGHGYLHGYSENEQDRLYRQARFLEPMIYEGLPYRRRRKMIEVGSGVGAQTEILLRRFPEMHVTCVEYNEAQIARAGKYLKTMPWTENRYTLVRGDATKLDFEPDTFDSGFICWVLEHVPDPQLVLSELRRVLITGSPVVLSEVLNATFFIDPYSPNTLRYWMAFNDRQIELKGDPFVGAKLGNLLQAVGFREIQTFVRTFHLDNRAPGERAEFIGYWTELLLSGAGELLKAGYVSEDIVEGMKSELARVGRDPNAVFFYSFIQAQARAF
ncbi:MAG: methyltransferase domain-containing protein [Planctomycetes bacterium]|nr:methyltransferase domain-containing protein [Planctomycetota bacterium]